MNLPIKFISTVKSKCASCSKEYIALKGDYFSPLGYIPGLCTNCNTDILFTLLDKSYPIFKHKFIDELFRDDKV